MTAIVTVEASETRGVVVDYVYPLCPNGNPSEEKLVADRKILLEPGETKQFGVTAACFGLRIRENFQKKEEKILTFSEALPLAREGFRIARRGWNGKNMYVFYVPEKVVSSAAGKHVLQLAYLGMRTAEGHFIPWLASQADILAEDWFKAEGDA